MVLASLTLELRGVTGCGLRDVSIELTRAALHAVVGDAGCSALLRLAGLLEPLDAGEVLIGGEATRGLSSEERGALRGRYFGFVFAAPYLLPSMTIVENVAVPYFKLAGGGLDDARERTGEVLAFAGLAERGGEAVGDLGWLEQQRVALARALVHRPAFLIVDHASAPLAGWQPIEELLREVPARFGAAVLVAAPPGFMASPGERVFTVGSGTAREALAHLPERESSPS